MLDRKIMSDLAEHHPKTFAKILEAAKLKEVAPIKNPLS